MLQTAGVLVDGQIKPKADADLTLRLETTSILNYLEQRHYLKDLTWLPADFVPYKDMQKTLGFEPAYEQPAGGVPANMFFANLDMQTPLDIQGYDVLLQASSYRGMDQKQPTTYDFVVRGTPYKLLLERLSPQETRVSVQNAKGTELATTGLYDFATSITGISKTPKEAMGAEELTLNTETNVCKLRIVFQNINITYGTGGDSGADYSMFILVAVP